MPGKEYFLNADGKIDTMESEKRILGLFGKYRPLSNFHMEPVEVNCVVFQCSEAAYMAEKTDSTYEVYRLSTMTGPQAKAYGQTVHLVEDWDAKKFLAMKRVLTCKFEQSDFCRELLLSTGNKYIEETNWWNDRYWGVDVNTNIGQNNLGKILMMIREKLRYT